MTGWVYAMASDQAPGVLRIGRTISPPARRGAALAGKAPDGPWRLVWQKQVSDHDRAEGLLALRLRGAAVPGMYGAYRTDLPAVLGHLATILRHAVDPAGDPAPLPKPRRTGLRSNRPSRRKEANQ